MKKRIAWLLTVLLSLQLFGGVCSANFMNDIPKTIGMKEEVSLKWGEREPLINSFEPGKVKFNVIIDLKRASRVIRYDVYVGVDGEAKKQLAQFDVVPGKKFKREIAITDIKNGKRTVEIEVRDGNRVAFSHKEDIIVIEGYSKQFMDEFTFSRINYQWTNGHTNETGTNNDLDRAYFAGLNAMRNDRLWSVFEKNPGAYDYSYKNHDDFLRQMKKYGFFELLVVGGGNPRVYPMWPEHVDQNLATMSLAFPEHSYAPTSREAIEAYIAYVKELDRKMNMGNDESTIELWSEPNQAFFWQPTDTWLSDYLNLVKSTTSEFSKVNPDKPISVMAIAANGVDDWTLGAALDNGIYPYMDEMSYHAYATHQSIDNNHFHENQLDSFQKIITDAGGWKIHALTESGWPTGTSSSSVSEEVAAENAVKLATIVDTKDVVYYQHSFKDTGVDPANIENNWGIIDYYSKPKLQYLALTHRNTMLRGGIYVGELDLGDDEIRAFVYLKEGKPVVQMWDGSPDREELEFTFEGEHLAVSDMYGTSLSKDTDTVTLTKYPIYLVGLTNKYIAMAAKADLEDDKARFVEAYKEQIDRKYVTAAETAFDNAIAALDEPTAEKIEASINEFDEVGKMLIAGAAAGEFADVTAAKLTFELREPVETLCVAYIDAYEGGTLRKPLYTVDTAKEKANKLYRNDNTIMQYSDAILTYAINTDAKVDKLINSNYDPEITKGYIAGWSLETKVYSDWFDAFSNHEEIMHYGYLTQVLASSLSAYINDEVKIQLDATNRSKIPFEGNIVLYDEDGNEIAASKEFKLKEGEYETLSLPFVASKRQESSERNLILSYVDKAGNRLTTTPITVTIKDKLSAFIEPCTTTVEEMDAVKLKFTNLTDQDLRFNLTVKSDKNYKFISEQAEVSMKAGETKIVEMPISEIKSTPFHFYTVKYEAVDGEGCQLAGGSVPMNFTAIVKTDEPMNMKTLSKDVSSWSNAYPIYINPPKDADDPQAWETADNAARAFLKWDESNLYMLVDIFDDGFHNAQTGQGIWDGDSIQLSLDSKNNKSTAYDGDDYEFGFALGGLGKPEVWTWYSPIQNQHGAVEWIDVVRDNNKKITRYLMAIPKSEIPTISLAEGNVIGLNVVVNEADALTREVLYEFTPGTGYEKNPSKWASFPFIVAPEETYDGEAEEIFPTEINPSESADALS